MGELLEKVEATDLAVPAPIEQRWSARSRSPMSPAHSRGEDDLHSWVGIIMYLPDDDEEQRAAITARFWGEYNRLAWHSIAWHIVAYHSIAYWSMA
mmetsp:Transcript_15042/g.34489  ORF Transcript_15042/g.34489 Transcript_15042/m.34489 type:complete len:96 (-) Transcript_15042:80-367(-)